MRRPHILSEKEHPDTKPIGVIYEGDKRMPSLCFDYPGEIESLFNDAEVRALLDEFIMKQAMRYLAQCANRILSEIVEAENPRHRAIVIAWSVGLRFPGISTEGDVLLLTNRSHAWLHGERKRVLKMLEI